MSIYSEISKVGDNIKKALAKRGKSQRWLAKQMGKDHTHINKWCNNRNAPTAENLEAIADILGFEMEEILTGKFEDDPKNRKSSIEDDPLIKKEVDSIIDMFAEAAKAKPMDHEEVLRYKKMIRGKIHTIASYLM